MIASGAGRFLERVRGTAAIATAVPHQQRAHYRSRDRILAARDERVRKIAAHAAATVPFYAQTAAAEIRSADELRRLPLVDKELLRIDGPAFRSSAFSPTELIDLHTNGTSGMPISVFYDGRALLRKVAYSERERVVESRFAGRRYAYPVVEIRIIEESAITRLEEFYGAACFRPLRPRLHVIPLETPIEETVGVLNHVKPVVLRGYGSHLEALFGLIRARGLEVHRPRAVVYGSDGMSPAGRQLIEEHFGIPVIAQYGAIEAFPIAFTCEARSGYHLNEDLFHVRLLDADGRDVAAGEPGEVVVSNLFNRGTVLLNYRLGDIARLETAPCACGRTTLRLAGIDGRVAEVLEVDGNFVHQYSLYSALGGLEDVLLYQLAQLESRRFELRLVTADIDAYTRVAGLARERVSRLLPGCTLEVTRRDELVADSHGKLRRLVPLPGASRQPSPSATP